MKKILSFALVVTLMAALFTGCGCAANVSDHPGGMITEEPTVMPRPTATHTTEPKATTLPRPTDETGTSSMPTMPGGTTEETSRPTDATIDQRTRNKNTTR